MAHLSRRANTGRYSIRLNFRGRWLSIRAYDRKASSLILLRQVESVVQLRETGQPLTPDLRSWARRLPDATRAKLKSCGLLEQDDARDTTLDAFRAAFIASGVGPRGRAFGRYQHRDYDRWLGRLADFTPAGRTRRLGDLPLAWISTADVTAFIRHAASLTSRRRGPTGRGPMSVAYVNKAKRILKGAFNTAIRVHEVLDVNPLRHISQDKMPDVRKRYVDPSEFGLFLGQIDKLPSSPSAGPPRESDGQNGYRSITESRQWWRAFALVLYTTGLRLEEAVNLTWQDVDFEAADLTVVAKTGSRELLAWRPKGLRKRVIPLCKDALDALAHLQAIAADGYPYVFLTPARRDRIRDQIQAGKWRGFAASPNLRHLWDDLISIGELNPFTRHDLRRSCITNWASDLPIHIVMELAGHVSIATTQQYYLALPERHREDARRVAEGVTRRIKESKP